MERTDWLDRGIDPAQARFLMVTAITHHRFSSPAWGKDEVRKLYAELAEIEASLAERSRLADPGGATSGSGPAGSVRGTTAPPHAARVPASRAARRSGSGVRGGR